MPTPLRAADSIEETNNGIRLPPHNYDAEKALLGAIFMNNRAFDKVSDYLQPEHFADPLHGRIYRAVQKLLNQGRQANPVTLKPFFENDEMMKQAGGIKYLAALTACAVTIINTGDYGKLIYDLYLRRELIALGQDVVNGAFDSSPDESATDQIEMAADRLNDLISSEDNGNSLIFEEAVDATMAHWEKHARGEIAGLSTGLTDLDAEMGLMEDGDLIVLAGPPASGKTALAFTIAFNAAKSCLEKAISSQTKTKRIMIFSAEMSALELAGRAMTTHTAVKGPRRRKTEFDENEWGRLVDFRGSVSELPLVIDDRGAPTLSYIKSRCRQEQRKGKLGAIVIDYLQIMGIEKGWRDNGRADEVSKLIRGVKEIARQYSCPVICLSQLKRGVENRDNKRPTLSDLRDSGEIEAAADIVAFCYREEYYLEMNEPTGKAQHAEWIGKLEACRNIAEIIIAKNRHNSTGTARLHFDRSRTLFSDLANHQYELPGEQPDLLI